MNELVCLPVRIPFETRAAPPQDEDEGTREEDVGQNRKTEHGGCHPLTRNPRTMVSNLQHLE